MSGDQLGLCGLCVLTFASLGWPRGCPVATGGGTLAFRFDLVLTRVIVFVFVVVKPGSDQIDSLFSLSQLVVGFLGCFQTCNLRLRSRDARKQLESQLESFGGVSCHGGSECGWPKPIGC